jgi:hypothetical protein
MIDPWGILARVSLKRDARAELAREPLVALVGHYCATDDDLPSYVPEGSRNAFYGTLRTDVDAYPLGVVLGRRAELEQVALWYPDGVIVPGVVGGVVVDTGPAILPLER